MAIHVYVDFDDVLCETAKLLIQVANDYSGRNLAFADIHSFDIGKTFELTEDQVKYVLGIMHKPENLLAIEPIENAAQTLGAWMENGVEIDIVTGRPPFTEESSLTWLKEHNIPYSRLLFVNKYARNHNGFDHYENAITLEELAKMHYDLAIDDSATMLRFLFDKMPVDVAVFHRPWNSRLEIPATDGNRKIIRCTSWPEIATEFTLSFPIQGEKKFF